MSPDIDERILSATTRGLERLGKNVSTVSYWKFQQDTGLETSKIPRKIEDFTSCISKLFGPGYPIIESSIAAELKQEFDVKHLQTNNFRELVSAIRKRALKESL